MGSRINQRPLANEINCVAKIIGLLIKTAIITPMNYNSGGKFLFWKGGGEREKKREELKENPEKRQAKTG